MNEQKEIKTPSGMLPYYLFSIVALSFLGVLAILGILYLAPPGDRFQAIAVVLGFLGSTLLSLFTLVNQQGVKYEVQESKALAIETHDIVNSRMTEMKKVIEALARAKGKEEGIAEQKLVESATRELQRSDQMMRMLEKQQGVVADSTPPVPVSAIGESLILPADVTLSNNK